jgi:hypothetical protein
MDGSAVACPSAGGLVIGLSGSDRNPPALTASTGHASGTLTAPEAADPIYRTCAAYGPRIRADARGDEHRDRGSNFTAPRYPQRSHVSRHSLKGLAPALLAATTHEAVRCRESHLSMLARSG